MWHILRLDTMDIKKESTCKKAVFWRLFNEISSDTKGKDYKFKPRATMVNESGANYCVIQKILGLILSHQWWSVNRCTTRMMLIGFPAELVQVTEIFQKHLLWDVFHSNCGRVQ